MIRHKEVTTIKQGPRQLKQNKVRLSEVETDSEEMCGVRCAVWFVICGEVSAFAVICCLLALFAICLVCLVCLVLWQQHFACLACCFSVSRQSICLYLMVSLCLCLFVFLWFLWFRCFAVSLFMVFLYMRIWWWATFSLGLCGAVLCCVWTQGRIGQGRAGYTMVHRCKLYSSNYISTHVRFSI